MDCGLYPLAIFSLLAQRWRKSGVVSMQFQIAPKRLTQEDIAALRGFVYRYVMRTGGLGWDRYAEGEGQCHRFIFN